MVQFISQVFWGSREDFFVIIMVFPKLQTPTHFCETYTFVATMINIW